MTYNTPSIRINANKTLVVPLNPHYKLEKTPHILPFQTLEGITKTGNVTRWTIYVGVCVKGTASTIFEPLNNSNASNVEDVISYFNKVALPIHDHYFSNAPIDGDVSGFYVVEQHQLTSKGSGSETFKFRKVTLIHSGNALNTKNRTNPFTLAVKKAFSLYTSQSNKYHPKMEIMPQLGKALGIKFTDDYDYADRMVNAIVKNNNSIKHNIPSTQIGYNDIHLVVDTKLDGTHCMATYNRNTQSMRFMSRKGTSLNVNGGIEKEAEKLIMYLNNHMTKHYNDGHDYNVILDGEIYLHGLPLNVINGWSNTSVGTPSEITGKDGHVYTIKSLQFHVFDCIITRAVDECDVAVMVQQQSDKPRNILETVRIFGQTVITNDTFFDRLYYAHAAIDALDLDHIYKTPIRFNSEIEKGHSYNDIVECTYNAFNESLKEGYEGLMLRSNYFYEPEKRNIIKYKPRISFEFPIHTYKTGKGVDVDQVTIGMMTTQESYDFFLKMYEDKYHITPGDFKPILFHAKLSGYTHEQNVEILTKFRLTGDTGNNGFQTDFRNKLATVEFAGFSPYAVPQHPNVVQLVRPDDPA